MEITEVNARKNKTGNVLVADGELFLTEQEIIWIVTHNTSDMSGGVRQYFLDNIQSAGSSFLPKNFDVPACSVAYIWGTAQHNWKFSFIAVQRFTDIDSLPEIESLAAKEGEKH